MTDLSISADSMRNRQVPAATAAAAGYPVTFADTLGFIHPGTSRRGVVMVAPWGYEGLCLGRAWRHLAGQMAGAGLPTIRFDWPGTGDALGSHLDGELCGKWIGAVAQAADCLRRHHEVDEIILAGFGVGVLLAAAARLPDVTGLLLLAPNLSGREYSRELTMRAKLIDDYLGRWPETEPQDGALAVAGFRLASDAGAGLKSLKFDAAGFPDVRRIFLADRPNHQNAERLHAEFGPTVEVTERDFAAYASLTFDPTSAEPPAALWAAAAQWAAEGMAASTLANASTPPRIEPLVGSGFKETPVRFGPDCRLFGVLCEPAGQSSAVVIMLNTGRSPHIGWARAAVDQARQLAGAGISSFRIDLSSIGDSLAVTGDEILYGDQGTQDVRSAIDFLDGRALGPVILSGGCSGAFTAFSAAAADPRVKGVAMINLQRLVWDPRESVASAMAEGVRNIGAQSAQMLSGRQWKRLLTGEIRIDRIARSVIRQIAGLSEAALVRRGLPISGLAKVRRQIIQRFDDLAKRGVPVRMIFGTEDRGLEEIARHFGRNGKDLARWPLISTHLVDQTDHNVTPPKARQAVTDVIAGLATEVGQMPQTTPVIAPAPRARVLMIQTQAENAGAQEISRLVGAGLDARGMETHHLFFYRRTAGLDGLPRRVDCASERPQGAFATLKLFVRIAKEIRRIRPDVVMTFQHYGNLFGAVLSRLVVRAPVIANQVSADGVTNKLIRGADRFLGAVGLYSRITVNSRETMRAFEQHPERYKRRIVHVPHGFENKSVTIAKPEARARFGLPVEGVLIGSAARLHPMKQLEAAIAVLALRPDWQLALAGQGQDESRLRAEAERLGVTDRVYFVGELKPEALGVFLAGLDVFVFPSLAETFGLAAVEAAQAGIPVVANRLDVLVEVLSSEGEPAARFVEARDHAALAAAIDEVLTDKALAERLTAAGRRLQDRYSLTSMVDAYEDLVVQALERKV